MPAILCPNCHKIVSPDADACIHCGQRKPGLWGATATMRKLGVELDFPHLITIACGALYLLMLALDPSAPPVEAEPTQRANGPRATEIARAM